MGSSVRKTSEKIKKLLKESIDMTPDIDSKDLVPQVAVETLKSKKTKNYFSDKDFIILVGGGFSCFKKIREVGYDSFLKVYDLKDDKLTLVDVQKIIESILDNIEVQSGEIDSSLILSAFQSAMTYMLLKELSDPKEFLVEFCERFIKMLVREEACEELMEAFSTVSEIDLDKQIADFSVTYVKDNFLDLIDECNNGNIKIDELIKRMQEKLKNPKEIKL